MRRSLRLHEAGYYTEDGTPSVSYKKKLYKGFKKEMDYDATLKDGVRKHLKFSDSLQRSRSTNDSQVINALETRIQANQTDKAQASTTKSQSTQIRAYRFWRTSASALGFKRNELETMNDMWMIIPCLIMLYLAFRMMNDTLDSSG